MTDITKIPDAELETDLFDTEADIKLCYMALDRGVTHYFDRTESVASRLRINKGIREKIMAEQARRKQAALDAAGGK